jgi:hypothetical protein
MKPKNSNMEKEFLIVEADCTRRQIFPFDMVDKSIPEYGKRAIFCGNASKTGIPHGDTLYILGKSKFAYECAWPKVDFNGDPSALVYPLQRNEFIL